MNTASSFAPRICGILASSRIQDEENNFDLLQFIIRQFAFLHSFFLEPGRPRPGSAPTDCRDGASRLQKGNRANFKSIMNSDS